MVSAGGGKIACVINPIQRNHDRAWQLVQQHCAALGFPPPLRYFTTIEHPGNLQTQQALDAGAEAVIGIGGDGTVRNISNMLAYTNIPLGIVPLGTANIFHLNVVGKQRRLDQAVRTAMLGSPIPVDLGRVHLDFTDNRDPLAVRFLVVMGIGHDANAIASVSPRLKRIIGPGAYFAAGARELRRAPVSMNIEIDGETYPESMAWSVLVGNCGVVPGGITVLPDASVQDGLLNIMQIRPSSLLGWVPIAWRGWRGSNRQIRSVRETRGREVTIIPEHPSAVQVDGDVWDGVIRASVQVESAALMVRTRDEGSDVDTADGEGDPAVNGGLDRPNG